MPGGRACGGNEFGEGGGLWAQVAGVHGIHHRVTLGSISGGPTEALRATARAAHQGNRQPSPEPERTLRCGGQLQVAV